MKTTRIISAVSLIFSAALIGIVPTVSLAQEYQADEVIIDSPSAYPQDPSINMSPGINTSPGAVDTTPGVIDTTPGTDTAPGAPLYNDLENQNDMDDMDNMDDMEHLDDTDRQSGTSRDVAPGGSAGIWKDRTGSYIMIKGGIYSPSTKGDLDDIDFGKKAGFTGEVAVGHYFFPFMAVELGAGYFQSKNSPVLPAGTDAMLRVVPLVATGKLLLPLGVFEPYGLFGIGAYISDADVRRTSSAFKGETDVTFGYHAGAGFNINFTDVTFVGLEGKYLWAEPEFGGKDLKLNGYITTIDVGFRF
ncbi:outer membrane beta-barrel protein [Pelotalea chapellei]|uniref:Outer membrane beta-barrel protein n=1 Tax=Pelotalea chapellei TaxID=44671 RepID=A0ABS5UB16_9BACT|nr:outer membrane beta-barrel protein [Pelotalea chapellei]MBT1072881.1 outer membrane beta-barrel protein [Pelotalea chapellei]